MVIEHAPSGGGGKPAQGDLKVAGIRGFRV